jgi:hypothetical protein
MKILNQWFKTTGSKSVIFLPPRRHAFFLWDFE